MIKKLFLPALLSPLLAACVAPKVAVNQNADFSSVKRVAVLSFGGERGEMAADLLTQSLLMSGADVIERQRLSAVMQEHQLAESSYFDQATAKKLGRLLGVDALFIGTVAESQASSKYLLNTGNSALVSDVTRVGNATIHSEGSVAGLPNSQVLSTTANATLMARMVDVQTGSIMWAASMSYEGFDLPSAMTAITDAFTDSLKSIWPSLNRLKLK